MHCRRYNPSVFLPERAKKQLPLHRGAKNALSLPRRVPRLSPPLAGCPHPSRCSAKAQRRATFPQGEGFAPVTSVPHPYKNVPRPAAHIRFSCARRARFIRRRRASCAAGTLHLQRKSAAPRHLPQGEGKAPRRLCATSLSKCAATRGTPKYFAAKRQNISHARSAYFTAPQARFHTAAKPPYITEMKESRC